MRTDAEIVAQIKARTAKDVFGIETGDLLGVLPFSSAQEFLKPGVTTDEFGSPSERTREAVLKAMHEYMDFAWGKALDHRGISAGRSVFHFRALVWLLGDEDYGAIEWDDFAQYGAPVLKAICDRFDFPMPDSAAAFRMAKGEPCRPDCEEGCGT
jgi:hypothetical protein